MRIIVLIATLAAVSLSCKPEPTPTAVPTTDSPPPAADIVIGPYTQSMIDYATIVDDMLSDLDTVSRPYHCPAILDRGHITGYYQDGELLYIDHVYHNGKNKSSHHRYYVQGGQLVLTIQETGIWDFALREHKQNRNVTTTYRYAVQEEQVVGRHRKKYIYHKGEDSEAVAATINYEKTTDKYNAGSIHKKYVLLEAALRNKRMKPGDCFY